MPLLTKQITLNTAMLRYLNGEQNTASAPNENYARELQELFTIGKDSGGNAQYTEDDVKAAARVLTGWRNDLVSGVSANGYNSIFNSNFSLQQLQWPWVSLFSVLNLRRKTRRERKFRFLLVGHRLL